MNQDGTGNVLKWQQLTLVLGLIRPDQGSTTFRIKAAMSAPIINEKN